MCSFDCMINLYVNPLKRCPMKVLSSGMFTHFNSQFVFNFLTDPPLADLQSTKSRTGSEVYIKDSWDFGLSARLQKVKWSLCNEHRCSTHFKFVAFSQPSSPSNKAALATEYFDSLLGYFCCDMYLLILIRLRALTSVIAGGGDGGKGVGGGRMSVQTKLFLYSSFSHVCEKSVEEHLPVFCRPLGMGPLPQRLY